MRNYTLIALLATTAACTTVSTPAEARKVKITPTFSIACGTVTEEGGSATCRITKTGSNGRASIIDYHTVEGTADADDYTGKDGSLTFRSNEKYRDVYTEVRDDHETEGDESFTWVIEAVSNGTVTTATGTTTISSNDGDIQTCDDGTVIPAIETCPTIEEPDPLPENPPVPEPEDPVVVPPPPTTTCPDGSIILTTGQCPAPPPAPTQTCWDGSIIPLANQCPAVPPTPTPTPTPAPTQTCWDGSVILTTATCPVPTPTPTPTPTGPNGVEGILSNFDINLALKTAGIPAHQPQVNEDKGAFRFICGPGQLNYDDPIAFHGQPGASHLHQYYGNTSADANSTHASLRAAGGSTCNIVNGAPADGVAANRSAYWMPAMLDGKGHVAMPDYVQVYYKQEPDNSLYDDQVSPCDPANVNKMGICGPIPNGLQFITGFNMGTGTNTQPGWFKCGGTGAANVVWKADVDGLTKANSTTCPVGSLLEMTMVSPKCWSGQIAAADHFSNMAKPVRNASTGWINKCPATHPYVVPQFTISAFFVIRTGDDLGLWQLSSDHMYPSLGRGKTLHFDYFEAWDPAVKGMWTEACLNEYRNGSAGNLCNGRGLIGADSGSVATFRANLNLRPDVPAE